MFVYSGECRKCETGLATNKKDIVDKELFTGDIVITFTKDYVPNGLTVVVCDQWRSFQNGNHELLSGSAEYYVMGIKGVEWEDDEWVVRKVKDHTEVIDGEHWKDFGFNYMEK
jgi:hypothetical protein